MKLHFLGANRQVTGSRYLLEVGRQRLLIDCGMFQERKFLERNWATLPVDPASIDYVLLTHGHLDHCGLLPRAVARGLKCSIITTEPTVDLARIIMEDSAEIQEEDAAYKRKRHEREGRKGPHPVEPLYTFADAERAAGMLEGVRYDQPIELSDRVTVTFRDAGHILGSAILDIVCRNGSSENRIVFTGDLGQWDKPLIGDPQFIERADYLVMESTYGDRNHCDEGTPEDQLATVAERTLGRGGNLVIPTFALERAQELAYYFGQLARAGRLPEVPIFLDSPMAVDVTEVFRKYRGYLDEQARAMFDDGQPPLHYPQLKLVRSVDESKAINYHKGPCIIMSASGMCTGGRIKHHLRYNIGRPESTILFVGYQAEGTLGRIILGRPEKVRIHGHHYPLRAETAQVCGFSAHGDRDDLLRWLGHFTEPAKQLFLTHGDYDVARKLQRTIERKLAWRVSVPDYEDVFEVGKQG